MKWPRKNFLLLTSYFKNGPTGARSLGCAALAAPPDEMLSVP